MPGSPYACAAAPRQANPLRWFSSSRRESTPFACGKSGRDDWIDSAPAERIPADSLAGLALCVRCRAEAGEPASLVLIQSAEIDPFRLRQKWSGRLD